MEDEETAAIRLDLLAKLLSALYGLIMIGCLIWAMIPEHQKKLMLMRLAATARRTVEKAAFRSGHQAMGLEISGCGENYSFPYALSLLAEKAGQVYERMRYSS